MTLLRRFAAALQEIHQHWWGAPLPAGMSAVTGRFAKGMEAALPQLREDPAWQALLVRAVGTTTRRDRARAALVLRWLWGFTFPALQDVADREGFGASWRAMLLEQDRRAMGEAVRGAGEAVTMAFVDKRSGERGAAAIAVHRAAVWAIATTVAQTAYGEAVCALRAACFAAEALTAEEIMEHFDPIRILGVLIEEEA